MALSGGKFQVVGLERTVDISRSEISRSPGEQKDRDDVFDGLR